MSAPAYRLRKGVVFKTLEELGVVNGTITVGGRDDLLDLTRKHEGLDDALGAFLEEQAYVTLFEGERPIFSGKVSPRLSARRAGIRRGVQIKGAWNELARRFYAQPWATGLEEGVGVMFGRVSLGWDAFSGQLVKTGEVIRNVLAWAEAHGANVQTGTVDDGVTIMPEYAGDQTCLQVIERMLAYTPDYVAWWDYSTLPPQFNCRSPEFLPVVKLPKEVLGDELAVAPSFDTRLAGVVMVVKTQTAVEPEEGEEPDEKPYKTSWQVFEEPEGNAVIGDEDVISVSFDAGDFEGYEDLDVEALLRGQATALLEAVQRLAWTGKGLVKGQTAPSTPAVGQRLSITGGEAGWATMAAPLRQTVRSLMGGTSEVLFGPPPTLTVDALVNLALMRRGRAKASPDLRGEQESGESGGQSYGFKGDEGEQPKRAGAEGFVNKQLVLSEVVGGVSTPQRFIFKARYNGPA